MTNSKRNWLSIFNRKEDKMPAGATMWTPDMEDDDVAEYHNPWLAVNREMATDDSSSTARFV